MKVKLVEFTGTFAIHLEAEDLKDAVALVRFGVNSTKQVPYIAISAYGASSRERRNDLMTACVVIGKRAQPDDTIPRRR